MRRDLMVLLPLVLAAGVVGHAQQPAASSGTTQPPGVTFKTDVNFVEIHAVVTDQRGNVVRDLAKGDFEVFEDGKPQTPFATSRTNHQFAFREVPFEVSNTAARATTD